MFKFIKQGIKTGIVTISYPAKPDPAPEGFRGRPDANPEKCSDEDYRRLADICPPNAMTFQEERFEIHYGRCIFCGLCKDAGPEGTVTILPEYEMATLRKEDLKLTVSKKSDLLKEKQDDGTMEMNQIEEVGEQVRRKVAKLFGRSLHIREVDTGSCNACEWEITALTNPIYDIQRFGIDFVASPRFADMLLVTGPVTRNMEIALKKTYDATPDPKLLVAVGACACDGGMFQESYATLGGLEKMLPVDVYIPGCPPRPQALLYGILLALDRVPRKMVKGKMRNL